VTVFFDASALVKIYVPEPGADVVPSVDVSAMISELTRVELPSAFWRKHRLGQLSAHAAERLSREFAADYYGEGGEPRFAVMRISDLTVSLAARLVARTDLRAGDAIQLASALVARQVGREVTSFAAFDARLRHAAAVEGFTLVPPALAA
jgi:predicted nucleic acid-binding protein